MLLDRLSQFVAQVRGLPILLAVGLVLLNFLLQFVDVPVVAVLAGTNVFLHLAVIIGLLGVLLSEALGAW
jgi:hypothetical protein